jgi:hypothetical protein
MTRKKDIEELSRVVSGTFGDKRKCFQLIAFPDNDGDFSSTIVRCREGKEAGMLRYYGQFSNNEIEVVKLLGVGEYKCWGTDRCMVVRIA